MFYLYLFLLLVNISFFGIIVFKNRFEDNLFLAIFSIIISIFISGVINRFLVGYYGILIISFGLFIFNVIYFIKNRKILKTQKFLTKRFLTPGFCVFTLFYLLLIFATYNRHMMVWDEYSHWGLVVKNMYYLKNFALGDLSTVIAKTYLSGSSLFQYFTMEMYGSFNEGIMYMANDLLILSIMISIFRNSEYKKNNIGCLILISLFLFMITNIFYADWFVSLYVDCLLAFAFLNILFSYYSIKDQNSLYKHIMLFSSFAFIIFVKDFGLILSGIALVIILIDNLFLKNKFEFKLKPIIKNAIYPVLYFMFGLVIKVIWLITCNRYIGASNNGFVAGTGKILDVIQQLFTFSLEPSKKEVLYNFLNRVISGEFINTIISISFMGVIIIAIILLFIIKSDDKKHNNRITWLQIAMFLCTVIYAFFILCCYLTIFASYEVSTLASYDRYMGTCALALLFTSLFLIVYHHFNNKKLYVIIGLTTAILLMYSNNFINSFTINARYSADYSYINRKQYRNVANEVAKYVKSGERVYLIIPGTDGMEYLSLRYQLTPILSNKENDNYTIGKPYYDGDVFTSYISPKEWKKRLQESYDYVVIYTMNDDFKELYGILFDRKDLVRGQIYRVSKDRSEKVILHLVNE